MDNNEAYSILKNAGEERCEIIFNRISGIQVRVIPLKTMEPNFSDTEVHFFGDYRGTPLAFETVDYNEQGIDMVRDAIRWYAEYREYPEMEIKNIEFNL
ncbi:hypothetical protein BDE36_3644 [Arcticibacter tournemirensis]|uniref:Uncharacterized protein n=1 Tax=Arcticibacter tournemirensis TaxID=699437 RepID=A0A4Q0M761_9SPHI|nr:hypothetical protein [Arcticibacter tournemirensis]KAA8484111.1 hypothetical protein F1649_07150 [Arcticibacter tournemirensis]RXF68921.1 hypothetical protein EKH83_14465 [Arcticibacter tournemirensis]TQM51851.1 hypothetical protein BDE36_3644 [Arcticibacter tournemirensis]